VGTPWHIYAAHTPIIGVDIWEHVSVKSLAYDSTLTSSVHRLFTYRYAIIWQIIEFHIHFFPFTVPKCQGGRTCFSLCSGIMADMHVVPHCNLERHQFQRGRAKVGRGHQVAHLVLLCRCIVNFRCIMWHIIMKLNHTLKLQLSASLHVLSISIISLAMKSSFFELQWNINLPQNMDYTAVLLETVIKVYYILWQLLVQIPRWGVGKSKVFRTITEILSGRELAPSDHPQCYTYSCSECLFCDDCLVWSGLII